MCQLLCCFRIGTYKGEKTLFKPRLNTTQSYTVSWNLSTENFRWGTNVLLICECPRILLAIGRYVKHIFELTSNKPVYDKCAVQLHVSDAIASNTKMDSKLS